MAPVIMLVIMLVIDFGRAVVDYNALASAARVGARYAASWTDSSGVATGVNLCTYDNRASAAVNADAYHDPIGQCADVLTHALAVAPQVARSDIAYLTVQRNGAATANCAAATSSVTVPIIQYCLTLADNFHPITGMILGGATISITVNAQYLSEASSFP